jgi:hypothetical protein
LLKAILEFLFLLLTQVLGFQEALVRGLGWAVFANRFGSFAGFAQELEVWAKEVVQESPGAVERKRR